MKIIKIQFASPKIYTYLLDYKTKVVPKVGDVLRHFNGATRYKSYFTQLNVVDVQEVDVLPPMVTTVINIKSSSLECDIYRLCTETLTKLRTKSKKSSINKEESWYQECRTANGEFDMARTLFVSFNNLIKKGGK